MSNIFSLNLERIPKELIFLLEILKTDNDDDGSLNLQLKKRIPGMDWKLFLDLVGHHRLYPVLYSKLKLFNESKIPHFVVQNISNAYRKNTFQMLHLTAVMEEVSRIFTENELRLLVLKGPVLAADLYGDISKRTCRDIDILVPIDDLQKAHNLLLKLGFEKEDNFQIDMNLNDWKWRHHHISFYHQYKQVKLEIHWRLNPGPGKEPTFNELWRRKRNSSLTNHPVYYLGREDLFFFLVTHGARHGWSRLRWLIDIHEIVGQRMDWNKANKLFLDYQTLHLGGQALILSSKLLKTPLHKECIPFTRVNGTNLLAQSTIFYLEKMVNLHTEPLPDDVTEYHNRYIFSLKSKQNKLWYLLSIFYPSITDIKTLKLPKYLYFLYFPLRPIFLVLRKIRKPSLN
ncbi:nucleotidyltransferase family protein [Neobacillus sp. FSL H8-0543]|uniref:nucleotidyltransferase domain-containing protein n=1 Tax=Neobacillus sp. FSL H8-0543 TaxID=2954672 RepID=UPI0031581A86